MSGYTYRGVLAGQPPSNSNNNHASEFEFNGKWYHAYHNRYVATQAGIATTYKRNLALEVLNFNADGSIQQVAYTTDGVPQVGYLNPYERVEAETMNAQSGVETERCGEGGMDVTQLQDGDWIKVRGVDFGVPGASSLSVRVASTSAGGSIEVRLGTATGTVIGTCNVPATGGQQSWMTTTCNVTGASGVKDVYFKFVGQNAQLFSFNYWQFSGSGGSSGGSGGATATGGTAGVAGGGTAGVGGAAGAGGAAAAGGRGGAGGLGGASGGGGASGSAGAARGGSASAGAPNTGGATAGGATSAGGAQTAGGSTSGGSVGASGTSAGGTGAASAGSTNFTGGSTGFGGSVSAGGSAVQGPASDGCSCTVVGANSGAWGSALGTGVSALLWSWRARSRRKPRRQLDRAG